MHSLIKPGSHGTACLSPLIDINRDQTNHKYNANI